MGESHERFASLLGWAAMVVSAEMPRDIQEASFRNGDEGQGAYREDSPVFFTPATL
jgi:hypothetical protein